MSVDDRVEAVVLSVDKENEKISLGIKQMEPDPWLTIEEKYPVNMVVTGKVRNLTAFGAFVELEEGIDGLVHISDMSWTRRIQHPSEVLKKSDRVDVKIIKIDHDNRRISLGYKQLQEDPWPQIAKKYSNGTECLGSVCKVLDRGVVVSLDGDVEGFVPVSQLGHKDLTDPTGIFNENDQLPLQVIEFDRNQHKIVLSVAAYYKKRERTELDQFLQSHPSETTQSMADVMPEELKQETTAADQPAEPVESSTPEAPATATPTAETPPETEAEAAPAAEADADETSPPEETPAPDTSSEDETKME